MPTTAMSTLSASRTGGRRGEGGGPGVGGGGRGGARSGSLGDHAQGAELAVGGAAQAAPELERLLDVVERLAGQALAGQHVRHTRRVRGERLGGDASRGVANGDDLLGSEERLARAHDE